MPLFQPPPCSLRQLQYLVAVADLGGFGKAAARCHVSQPSLSAQVAQAERALGVRVFERNRRHVRVTAAGSVLLSRARDVLVAARDLAETARQEADPFTRQVRVGVIPTVCPYLLPEITPPLRAAYPRLTIQWSEERTAGLVARIHAGDLDAAVLALDAGTDGLAVVEIGRDPFVLAAAAGHPLLTGPGPVSPAALDGADVLLLEDGHCLRDQALDVCARAGAAEAGFRATSLSTLVQLVVASRSVTLLPALAVPVENRTGQLAIRPFTRPAPGRTLALAWRRGSALSPTLEAIGRTLQGAHRAHRARRRLSPPAR